MPFDGTMNEPAMRRARLVAALREGVPGWDFTHCTTCAIGLASRMGLIPELPGGRLWTPVHAIAYGRQLQVAFGLAAVDIERVFGWRRGVLSPATTPAMVADALEAAPLVVTADA